jgi:hypothetical protein
MGLVTLEEERVIAFRADLVDLAVISGRHIKIAGLVEEEVPYVFRGGSEVDRGTPGRIQRWFGCIFLSGVRGLVLRLGEITFLARLVLDFVDLAIGGRRGVNHATRADLERLHLQFLRLENDGRFSVGRDAIHARGRSGGGINISGVVCRNRPDIC